jgi:spore coat protein CotH
MAITINGSGITSANIADGAIVNADVSDLAASKLTGALPAISGASLTSLTSSQVDSGSTTAKAWVNFNGNSTIAIRDSFNVSSLTDRGTGVYTVNFTNALTTSTYSALANCAESITDTTARNRMALTTFYSTTSVYVNTFTTAGAADDVELVVAQVFGN